MALLPVGFSQKDWFLIMANLHTVLPPISEIKMMGDEPTWTGEVERYNAELLRGLNWHNYCATDKDYIKYMEQWLKVYRAATFKQDIITWRNYTKIRNTICTLARMQLQGFPISEEHLQHIENYVKEFTKVAKKTKTVIAQKEVNKPTIQDRIRAQVSGVLSDLDVRVDDAFDGNLASSDDIKGDILSKGFKGPQLKLVQEYLTKNLIEWKQAYAGEDEQLSEGYSYVGKRNFKKIIDTFTEVMDALSQQSTRIKSQRIRKRKPVDKKKMASKLRFMTEFEGIKSQNPVNIIGANMVWVYDTKKRRLGYYEAEVKDSLYVKGNKIQGFKNSCEKILRKPDEQLSMVMGLRKNQTLNWMDTIKAKCKPMTGRMTLDTLILRID